VVADSEARIPLGSRLVSSAREVPVIVAATDEAPAGRREGLARAGVEVLVLPEEGGHVSLPALMAELGRRRMSNVLLEGGGELVAAALASQIVDKLLVFVAPRILGGREAPTPVGGLGIADLAQALQAREWTLQRVGDDALIEVWL
jgi:diaminohydroxyphosphoribosylaminopyrimidine deaminase/5-amino-6-(5-phosphoribosylamino)uracil reductase